MSRRTKPASTNGDAKGAGAAARSDGSASAPPGPAGTTSDSLGRSLALLSKVRSGEMPGAMLAPGDRQALVTLLSADGLSTAEIAQILQVADRTIERDRRAIREAHAVPKDPRLVEQMVGRLMAEAELAVQRIRRAARERDVEPVVKIDAEHRCFQIVRDLVQSLQRLGYLPTAAQKVEADLTHHIDELPSLSDLQAEIERLKLVEGPDGLIEVEQTVARATLASHIRSLTSLTPAPGSVAPGAPDPLDSPENSPADPSTPSSPEIVHAPAT